ncbi:MAG: rhodanese-related sulfurtransferase [Saprospirales bacterium]|nr:MAG: rhodanese-related sulfurtransferase [Saprospirales bacterium]
MQKLLFNRINREELKEKLLSEKIQRRTLSFYQYFKIEDSHALRNELFRQLDQLKVLGRVYVASEGINAQISVPEENFEALNDYIYNLNPKLNGIRLNTAIEDDGKSFFKLTIKVRHKIVADGLNDDSFDPSDKGIHLPAEKFNELAEDPDTVIVDMRNHYESEVGHFENAICPDVETFREALPEVENILSNKKDKNIVMYCTGGIRCEKASAYFKHRGFKKVHQLEGGIIEYARQVRKKGLENKFVGKNFVFDERLGERISEEVIARCHQCGKACDEHVNCANDACHILFIQCADCAQKYNHCCSAKCRDFIKLPLEQQRELRKTEEFNGTKCGKGRYKAYKPGQGKELEHIT